MCHNAFLQPAHVCYVCVCVCVCMCRGMFNGEVVSSTPQKKKKNMQRKKNV